MKTMLRLLPLLLLAATARIAHAQDGSLTLTTHSHYRFEDGRVTAHEQAIYKWTFDFESRIITMDSPFGQGVVYYSEANLISHDPSTDTRIFEYKCENGCEKVRIRARGSEVNIAVIWQTRLENGMEWITSGDFYMNYDVNPEDPFAAF